MEPIVDFSKGNWVEMVVSLASSRLFLASDQGLYVSYAPGQD